MRFKIQETALRVFGSLMAVLLLVSACSLVASAREIVVTSTEDSGAGTLRSALQSARSGDVITFDPAVFPPDNPATIHVRSGFPALQRGNLTIDGSNAGVILDGSGMPDGTTDGFYVISGGNVIQGLQIIGFPANGITLDQSARNNTIGGDRGIGAGPVGQGNVLSKNRERGIGIFGGTLTSNLVLGNFIGTDGTQTFDWGNHWEGVFVESGGNTIGPDNVIAYNARYGIDVALGAEGTRITQNSIHDNDGPGIRIPNGPAAPLFLEFDLSHGLVAGRSCEDCTVELYSDSGNQGQTYEGTVLANEWGYFSAKGTSPFQGPNLTAIAIDQTGNTSAFSAPRTGTSFTTSFQEGNSTPASFLLGEASTDIRGNRMGGELGGWDWDEVGDNRAVYAQMLESVRSRGLTWIRLSNWQSPLSWQEVLQKDGTHAIPADCDTFVTDLADMGVEIILVLSAGAGLDGPERGWWGSPGNGVLGDREPEWWFRTQQERNQFCSFAQFMVQHFKGRIAYYEIWNEPDSGENPGDPRGGVRLADYVRLIEQVSSIIHGADSEAYVMAGAVGRFYNEDRNWLEDMLRSGATSIVDAISWHPFYGESPLLYSGQYTEHPDPFYWKDYPANVRSFVEQAQEEGYRGEYIVEEMVWRTLIDGNPNEPPVYSDIAAAKYMARASVMQLGLGVFSMVGTQIPFPDFTRGLPQYYAIQHISAVMAGHESIDMPVEIDIETEGPVAYCSFRYPNGDRMLAVWTDGIAQDEDPGVSATIMFPELIAGAVTGIDVLHGFEQDLVFEADDDDTIVRDLLVKDYPILIRLSDPIFGLGYEEIVGDGFHRIGDINAVPDSSGSTSDRDGDGVPDDEDFCPDWPGSTETSGC